MVVPDGRPDAGISDDHLAAAVREGAPDRLRSMHELGRRGRADLVLDLAADRSLRRPGIAVLPGLTSTLADLAAGGQRERILDAVRAWQAGEDADLRDVALRVPARQGDTGDLPALLEVWDRHLADEEWCALEDIAKAFERLGFTAGVPLLVAAYDLTPHSYARPIFLRALAALSPSAAEPLLGPALHDAEPDQRILASEWAPFTSSVLATLADLAADEHEDEDVRTAAIRRLG